MIILKLLKPISSYNYQMYLIFSLYKYGIIILEIVDCITSSTKNIFESQLL